MNWNEFIENLTKAKQEKRIVGNVTTAFTNLLYFGALDSIIGKERVTLKEYDQRLEDIKKALKSKSKKPAKKKSEDIGLAEVRDEITLGYWRYQNNPIAKIDMKSFLKNHIESRGFCFFAEKDIRGFAKMEKEMVIDGDVIRDTAFVSENFQIFFDHPALRKLFLENKGKRVILCENNTKIIDNFKLGIMGMVVSRTITRTKNGSEKMAVTLFTGQEKTPEIIFWPPRGSTEIPKNIKDEIKKLSIYIFFVNLSEYQGLPAANVRTLYNKKKNEVKYSLIKVLSYNADKDKEGGEEKRILNKNTRREDIKSVV